MRVSRPLASLAPALVLLLLAFVAGSPSGPGGHDDGPARPWLASAFAEEPEGDEKKGDGTEEGDDLGDKHVPFSEQVNKAIEQGVNWLLAKPDRFSDRKNEFVHYGRINSPTLYGGGTGPGYGHPAGATALAVYTLLKCGVSPKHEVVKKGLAWLREKHRITEKYDYFNGRGSTWDHTEAGSSYELSAMILALTAKYDAFKKTSGSKAAKRKGKLKIRDRDDREWLTDMVNALIERRGMPVDGAPRDERIGWRYNVPTVTRTGGSGGWTRTGNKTPPHGNQDLSSTQLAALALFSAQRFGIKVPVEVWSDILEFTLKQQDEDGPEVERHVPGFVSERYGGKPKDKARGFAYIKGSPHGSEGVATGSMTACGIANVLICREMLAKDKKMRKKMLASGELKKLDTSIFDGLAWLDKNWSSFRNPKTRYGYHVYYLYCVERTMDIIGKRLIGKRMWYPAGAKELLKLQKPKRVNVPDVKGRKNEKDGVFWKTDSTHDPKDVLDTCFALLYLKRATRGLTPPVAVTGAHAGGARDGR
ncbi:MAG: hypothetical protein P1V36_07080 [Planctomycetota bacterium]|nr:hypothetical protein [Planctomycetota bacterium]